MLTNIVQKFGLERKIDIIETNGDSNAKRQAELSSEEENFIT